MLFIYQHYLHAYGGWLELLEILRYFTIVICII